MQTIDIIDIPFSLPFIKTVSKVISTKDDNHNCNAKQQKIIVLASNKNALTKLSEETKGQNCYCMTYTDFALRISDIQKDDNEKKLIEMKELMNLVIPNVVLKMIDNATYNFGSLQSTFAKESLTKRLYNNHYTYLVNKRDNTTTSDDSYFELFHHENGIKAEFIKLLDEYLNENAAEIISNKIHNIINSINQKNSPLSIDINSGEKVPFREVKIIALLSIEEDFFVTDLLSSIARIAKLSILIHGFSKIFLQPNFGGRKFKKHAYSKNAISTLINVIGKDKVTVYELREDESENDDLVKRQSQCFIGGIDTIKRVGNVNNLNSYDLAQNSLNWPYLILNNKTKEKIKDKISFMQHNSYAALQKHTIKVALENLQLGNSVCIIVNNEETKKLIEHFISLECMSNSHTIETNNLLACRQHNSEYIEKLLMQLFLLIPQSIYNTDCFINILLHPLCIFRKYPKAVQKIIEEITDAPEGFSIASFNSLINDRIAGSEDRDLLLSFGDEISKLKESFEKNNDPTEALHNKATTTKIHLKIFQLILLHPQRSIPDFYSKQAIFCEFFQHKNLDIDEYCKKLILFTKYIALNSTHNNPDVCEDHNKECDKMNTHSLKGKIDIMLLSEIRMSEYDIVIVYENKVTDGTDRNGWKLYDFYSFISLPKVIFSFYTQRDYVSEEVCMTRLLFGEIPFDRCRLCKSQEEKAAGYQAQANSTLALKPKQLQINTSMLSLSDIIDDYSFRKLAENQYIYYIENTLKLRIRQHWNTPQKYHEKNFLRKMATQILRASNNTKNDIGAFFNILEDHYRGAENGEIANYDKLMLSLTREYLHYTQEHFAKTDYIDSSNHGNYDIFYDSESYLTYKTKSGTLVTIISKIDEIFLSYDQKKVIINHYVTTDTKITKKHILNLTSPKLGLNIISIRKGNALRNIAGVDDLTEFEFICQYKFLLPKYEKEPRKLVKLDEQNFEKNLIEFIERIYKPGVILKIPNDNIRSQYTHFIRSETYIKPENSINLKSV